MQTHHHNMIIVLCLLLNIFHLASVTLACQMIDQEWCTFMYIGTKTTQPRGVHLYNHNSGYGSTATEEPYYLYPYHAVKAYITGFDGNEELMLAVEGMWKKLRDDFILNGENDPHEWAKQAMQICNNLDLQQRYSIKSYDFKLVLLFQD